MQAPQRLSKTKREDNRHFALFLTTPLLSCTPKTSDLCPLLSCCHGEGPIHNPLCSAESLNY
ncbi:phospholamban [Columba livia]|uniref:Phospholamban n=1 Tax=Columba livia TaxID=8932 RepID=A0A2I0MV01_COLLI|nr:phospholamban [Columba livia]